jgi:endonuclease/exonuclease/phosphatase family metal-dependent hydrolase
VIAALAAAVIARDPCREPPPPPPLKLATFNIETFPKHAQQIEGAFAELAAIDAGFVAVQELARPDVFEREARRRLGAHWRLVHVDTRPIDERRPGHHIGVVFDTRRFALDGMAVHDDTRLDGRHKPTLEVRLRHGDGRVRVMVVHLKAGTEGRPQRARQLRALAAIIHRVRRPGELLVVLGDFNATEASDREDLAWLARDTGLVWATEGLACTAFWSRDDGCPRSRLDHVLVSRVPLTVHAAGACASEGCDWQDRCPRYADLVSDHCPVVVTARP